MKHYTELFEFLCQLIDIQIKKYVALTKIGVGPDAGMNAKLVADGVEELFEFGSKLLDSLEKASPEKPPSKSVFELIFNQIKFHFDQEYLRGYAAWLIDENHIHSPEMKRLDQQQATLNDIAVVGSIKFDSFPAINRLQQQIQYDSHQIAFLILDFAIQLKANPEMEFDQAVPKHAQDIMRKHVKADGRYNQSEIWDEIERLHQTCQDYLTDVTFLEKSSEKLSRKEAMTLMNDHHSRFTHLLDRYKKIQPDSELFSSQHQWFNIGDKPSPHKTLSVAKVDQCQFDRPRFFMLVAWPAAVAVAMLIIYIMKSFDEKQQEQQLKF